MTNVMIVGDYMEKKSLFKAMIRHLGVGAIVSAILQSTQSGKKITMPMMDACGSARGYIPYSGNGRSRTFKANLRQVKKHQRYRAYCAAVKG